jgi:hypothetical protein
MEVSAAGSPTGAMAGAGHESTTSPQHAGCSAVGLQGRSPPPRLQPLPLFQVKTGRWRGAVFPDEPADDAQDWLAAAGTREEGAPDDFYAALHAQACAARQRYNAEFFPTAYL